MALNHNHTAYDNFVLANEIEDQFNSKLDLLRFVTVDNSLEGVAGDKVLVHVYRATSGTEQLEMGEGNTKNIEVSYSPEEYRILLLQNRFPWYDEQAMKDPLIVETGVKHAATDMFNASQKRIMDEYGKTTQSVITTAYNFDAFVDAVAALDVPEANDNGAEVFAFINEAQKAELRKALKDDLKYVEAFAVTGYVGTVAGVNVYVKKDAPAGYIVVATREAVKYFVKKGTEVELSTSNNRSAEDANVRLNYMFSRKYFLPALVDETKAVRLIKSASSVTKPTISTTSIDSGTVGTAYSETVSASGSGTIKFAIERGDLPDGLALAAATGVISGTPTVAGTFTFVIQAYNEYGVTAKELSITIAAA